MADTESRMGSASVLNRNRSLKEVYLVFAVVNDRNVSTDVIASFQAPDITLNDFNGRCCVFERFACNIKAADRVILVRVCKKAVRKLQFTFDEVIKIEASLAAWQQHNAPLDG